MQDPNEKLLTSFNEAAQEIHAEILCRLLDYSETVVYHHQVTRKSYSQEYLKVNFDEILAKAYETINLDQPTSTEDITCDPFFRQKFLEIVHVQIPEIPEARALRRLSYLRKRSRLPRRQHPGGSNTIGK